MADSPELQQLKKLLREKKPLTAMLAPSFPIDFSYPKIVSKLKRVGFQFVVEVAAGAVDTNCQVLTDIQKDKTKRVITSPCPNTNLYIKTKFPQLLPYLSHADSPMVATARLVRQYLPNTKPVFIGPCLVKKIEAGEYPELEILALTFKDIISLFQQLNTTDQPQDSQFHFDALQSDATKLYPISGGLAQSAGFGKILAKDEYRVVSGPTHLDKALQEFSTNPKIRVLDILYCYGGCIAGLGITSAKSIQEKRDTVLKFWNKWLAFENDLEKI